MWSDVVGLVVHRLTALPTPLCEIYNNMRLRPDWMVSSDATDPTEVEMAVKG